MHINEKFIPTFQPGPLARVYIENFHLTFNPGHNILSGIVDGIPAKSSKTLPSWPGSLLIRTNYYVFIEVSSRRLDLSLQVMS